VISGLYTAASGMIAQQAKQDILANNLANADTPGFKADLLTIDSSADLPNTLSDSDSPAAIVRPGRLGIDASSGILKPTGNPLNLAIMGRGLFVVETPQGERFTRAGSFTRDSEGFLATSEGFRVLGSGGPIRVPDRGLQVDGRGGIANVGSLRIVAGPDEPGLVKIGGNLYAVPNGSPPPQEVPEANIVQGHLESSNVNVVQSMVEMLASLRTYEAYQRTIQALDQTTGQAANELGRA